ncbi:SpoVT / AbrB like domain protein [gamma proteobacterium NOR5-3]|nr:SpoVT / AbrB like domain protein [gamma proteobacterium NOR5-3]
MHTKIRKWGNSAGAIIPAPVLAEVGIDLGDAVDIEAVDGTILIKQVAPSYTLDELLKACPQEAVTLNVDEKAWLRDAPVGKELA